MRGIMFAPFLCLALVGCASMPKITVTYRFPKAETNIVVTQTLACSMDNMHIVSAISATANTTYSSNADITDTGTINFGDYGGLLTDADLGPTFTADGRLSGINSSTTGEGATIVKSAVTVATGLAGTTAFRERADLLSNKIKPFGTQEIKDTCTAIANFLAAGSVKVITLTYSINVLYDHSGAGLIAADPKFNPNEYSTIPGQSITLKVDQGDIGIHDALPAAQFPLYVTVVSANPAPHPTLADYPTWSDKGKPPRGFQLLKLNTISGYVLRIYGPDGNFEKSVPIWEGEIAVPLRDYYPLAVPSGMVFGKQGLTLSLSDSGSVTKLEYSSNTGASDALTAAGSATGTLPTSQSQAQNDQSQADLIYQQQRLTVCKATPTSCTK